MTFSSSLFLVYFLPLFLLMYYLIDKKRRAAFSLVASILFFAWGAPVFVFVILVSIIPDHYLIRKMMTHEGKMQKRTFLVFIFYNLSLLVWFKYANFLIVNVNWVLSLISSKQIGWTKVVLPLAISFIVFQKICYAIDVKRRVHPPASTLGGYAYYIFMFPKLLAGPIVRFREVIQGVEIPIDSISYDARLSGFFRFSIGLAKKVFIANVLGYQVDQIFSLHNQILTTQLAWIGALAYAFQIYFDFSGYSDMAIGLACMMGFRFPENFNNPYISGSITEFWKRWHMTLSGWLRDYIFLPDAWSSSRRMKKESYFGLKTEQWIYMEATLVTMAVCGIWHGAAWTFIVWGLLQGFIMVSERLFLMKLYKKTGKYLALPVTFFFILMGWIIFRSENLDHASQFITRLFTWNDHLTNIELDTKFWTVMVIAALFSFAGLSGRFQKWQTQLYNPDHSGVAYLFQTLTALVLFIVSLSAISSSGFNPFIYFRF